MQRKIKFVASVIKWFDKANGNTYHSVRIQRMSDGTIIACVFQYGYGDHYKQTALEAMAKEKWLPKKYRDDHDWRNYEHENNYPVDWNVSQGSKRDCIANGII